MILIKDRRNDLQTILDNIDRLSWKTHGQNVELSLIQNIMFHSRFITFS